VPTRQEAHPLARTRGVGQLKDIKDDSGKDFDDNSDRLEYICSYYETLFKCDNETESNIDYNNCIQDFLGPEIIASPLVELL
jgi:hypothetical protein